MAVELAVQTVERAVKTVELAVVAVQTVELAVKTVELAVLALMPEELAPVELAALYESLVALQQLGLVSEGAAAEEGQSGEI